MTSAGQLSIGPHPEEYTHPLSIPLCQQSPGHILALAAVMTLGWRLARSFGRRFSWIMDRNRAVKRRLQEDWRVRPAVIICFVLVL